MIDLTDKVWASLSPLDELSVLQTMHKRGDSHRKRITFAAFNDLADLVKHRDEFGRGYVWVHGLRFRLPEIAVPEMMGREYITKSPKNDIILHDRYGKMWCWGYDITKGLLEPSTWYKPRIKKSFSDGEIISEIFGLANFGASFSGPIRAIEILRYKGRFIEGEKQKEVYRMPALAYQF